MSIGGKSKNENMLRNLRNCVPITGPVTSSLSTYLSQFTEICAFFSTFFFHFFIFFFIFPPFFSIFSFFSFFFLQLISKSMTRRGSRLPWKTQTCVRSQRIASWSQIQDDHANQKKKIVYPRLPSGVVSGHVGSLRKVCQDLYWTFSRFFWRKRIFDGVKALS